LTIFNEAAEQMRFYRSHQWQVTYYAVIAYAALAAAPIAVPRGRWRDWVTVFAAVLVLLAGLQAGRTLLYSNDVRVTEHARLKAVVEQELPLIDTIFEKHPTKERWDRGFPLWMPPRPRLPWGLLFVVILGAVFALMIIILSDERRRAGEPEPPDSAGRGALDR
jgi:hypothetical protein